MGIVDWIKDLILGVKVISVDDARKRFDEAVSYCDINGDGWLDIREFSKVFRELMKK